MFNGTIDCHVYNASPQLRDEVFFGGDDWMDIDD